MLETNLNWPLIYFAARFFAFVQLSFDLIPFLAIWYKQTYTERRQTKRRIKSATQKTKKISNTDLTKTQTDGSLTFDCNRWMGDSDYCQKILPSSVNQPLSSINCYYQKHAISSLAISKHNALIAIDSGLVDVWKHIFRFNKFAKQPLNFYWIVRYDKLYHQTLSSNSIIKLYH